MTTKINPDKCSATKLKKGTKWSRISYGEILDISYNQITVRNEKGTEWTVTPAIVEDEFFTPDQYEEVKEVNRTEMVNAIVGNARIIMSVHFKKKPDHKDLVSTVTELLDDEKGGRTRLSSRKLSSLLKAATAGEDRTMIGRHQGVQDEFGRLQFTDMESPGVPLKQVDPRTVEWAIVGNVKYVLK